MDLCTFRARATMAGFMLASSIPMAFILSNFDSTGMLIWSSKLAGYETESHEFRSARHFTERVCALKIELPQHAWANLKTDYSFEKLTSPRFF